jgi:hypothetical protein
VAARLRLQADLSIESGACEGVMKGGLILFKDLPARKDLGFREVRLDYE